MEKKRFYLILLIIGTAFWGISFSFVKVGIGSSSPFVFLTYKFLLAGLCLMLIFHKKLKYISISTLKISIFIGSPLLLGTILQTIGLKYTTVSNSAFITGLDVLLIPILKFLVYKRKVEPKIWIACGIALVGLFLIALQDSLSLNIGDIWTIACAFGFALYVLQVGRFSNEKNPIPAVIMLMLFCGIGCFLCAIFDNSSVWVPTSLDFWKGILFAAIPATAYMYTVQNIGQRYIAEEKVALTYLCEPIFATTAGFLLLNEELTIRTITGGLLIIFGMLIAELNFKKRRKRKITKANGTR
ncbi:DMT family transporter [Sphingobacterium sp. LRF_L2]|uniref:DMT family transporter n=1 Tax=Sphingobacterium sp. LRF_L2 TaxID=3369421 RepID=UPI003F625409